jgi:hypothetical protein
MQNVVDKVISGFSAQELKKFKNFLQRNEGFNRTDTKIVDEIRKGINDEKKSNASRQARKRLKIQLNKFALIENAQQDEISEINSLIEMAKYLFRKNLYEQAWHYLLTAEQMAIKLEEYELLNFIYYIQISYSSNMSIANVPVPSTLALLDKCEENLSLAITDIRANSAYAYLLNEISELFSKELYVDMDLLIDTVLKKYHLDDKIYDSPKIYSKIVNLVCRALRTKQDYEKLKEYSMKSYHTMSTRNMFEKISREFRIELMRSICSSTIRTKEYDTCETFWGNYSAAVEEYGNNQHDKYLYYFFLLNITSSDLMMCTNRLAVAREKLLNLNTLYGDNKQPLIHFMLRINLLAMHFKHQEYSTCIKIISIIMQQDQKKILKAIGMGLEIIFYTDIYTAIIHYDNDDKDYASHLLQRTKRKYADILNGPGSKREQIFIRILEKLINDPSYIGSKKFLADESKFSALKTYIPGDKEYISFNAWLASKRTNTPYYNCFLELVN